MRRISLVLSIAAAAAAIAGACRAGAQTAPTATTYALHRDSLATRADSLRALAELDEMLRADRTDAAIWHRRGVLAWRLSHAEQRTGYMKRVANDSLLSLADSSLRLATRYAPHTPGYLVDLGRFDLTSNSASVRGRAHDLFRKALKTAERRGDSLTVSRASDGLGMTWWRRYIDRANQNIYSYIIKNVKKRTFTHDPRSIAYFIDNQSIRAADQDWSGQLEYDRAWDYFARALRADSANEGALRHTYMALADRQRWVEVQHVSRVRLAQDSSDAWAWLAQGMAEHRLGDDRASAAAFHRGLPLLPQSERDRIFRLSRIFKTRDSVADARLPDFEQENVRRMYWLMADPLWSMADNEHRLEFLSRVVYAELRFSVEEFGIHGADSERGEVYVRYGPPPAIISFPPDPTRDHDQHIRVLWWYGADETFLFDQLPTFGVVRLEPGDRRELRRLRDTIPVVWRNAGERNMVDSVNLEAARFRARGDSGDVFVAADVPVHELVRGVDLARGALRITLEGFNWRAERVFDQTSRHIISFQHGDTDEIRSWRQRVRAGTYLYRVEAFQPDAGRGARGASRIEMVPEKGFGLSDLLVAARVSPHPGETPARWTDFDIRPNFGRVHRGQPFGLLWETYDLAPRDGSDNYDVAITIARKKSSGGVGGFFARIVGGVAGAVGLSRATTDSVTLQYPRRTPASRVAVDYVTLDVGNAPPGRYVVTVTVTDKVSGRQASGERAITVLE